MFIGSKEDTVCLGYFIVGRFYDLHPVMTGGHMANWQTMVFISEADLYSCGVHAKT